MVSTLALEWTTPTGIRLPGACDVPCPKFCVVLQCLSKKTLLTKVIKNRNKMFLENPKNIYYLFSAYNQATN